MNNFKLLSLAALLWLPTMLTNAKVRLPHLLSDGMIVQQNADVRLWGWDKPGTTVRVTTSWSDETAETQTGKNGEFLLTVRTPKANAYYYWTKGIIITCPEVKHPVAVRYGFRNFLIGNVANAAHLPLFPWRSDNW